MCSIGDAMLTYIAITWNDFGRETQIDLVSANFFLFCSFFVLFQKYTLSILSPRRLICQPRLEHFKATFKVRSDLINLWE